MRFSLVVVVVVVAATGAQAHVLLEEPRRRYDDMKGAICGKGGGDDGRTSAFHRFQPGETIAMAWTETIDHTGSFRVAFDDDGADRADFDANVLYEQADPDNESNFRWDAEVTLPDIECTNCTLQLIQVMTEGVANDGNTYFQCSDIVLGDGESAGAEVGCASSSSPPWGALALLLLLRRRRR
ncbi:MAG: lytic polysaccharide monooxygenase [Deltaproteobacteria bacterium]|nr:lytic polysaccharide monooxygenase [Deltaproteobacteria bacterium]